MVKRKGNLEMAVCWDEINKKFEIRCIRPEESDAAVAVEHACFPPNEACSKRHMMERIAAAPELFLVAIDRKTGEMAAILNGLSTKEEKFRDEFFTDSTLYDPKGRNVMLLGLAVRSEYRLQGLASALMQEYAKRMRAFGKEKLILTCLESRVPMYRKMGFSDDGMAASTWGGECWHEMSYSIFSISDPLFLL